MRLRSPVVFACIATAFLAGGCRQSATSADQARADQTLLISAGPEPGTLDPHRNTSASASFIIAALWDPLVDWNEDATRLVPAAAQSWSISDDGRTYTFHLRPNAQWSNGEPITAHDWVRSFQRFVTPAIGAELANIADPVVGVTDFRQGRTSDPTSLGFHAPDDHTLVIELTAPYAGFIEWLTSYPWLPLHLPSLEAAGGIDNPMANFAQPGQLVSNGPFVLTAWRPDQFVEVTRNPRYPEPARLRAIRFFAMDNVDTMERAFRSGQLHITDSVPPAKIATYLAAHDPALHLTPRIGLRYLSINTQRPPFNDVRVRQAFSLALDRRQLADVVLRNGARPAFAEIEAIPGGYQPTLQLSESVAQARALLAAAGYPEGRGFPPTEYLYNTADVNRTVAEALQHLWRSALSVEITLRNEEWKVFLETRHRLDYQISRSAWLPFTAQPQELYELQSTNSPSNETGWSNPTYDGHFAAARHAIDPAARHAHFAAMDEILHDEMPVIPLAYFARSRLIDPAVDGWPVNPLEAIVWKRIGFRTEP